MWSWWRKGEKIVEIENRLRDDLWDAIKTHYEHEDYTEAVRDALLFATEMLRDLSGEDKDGSKLVDATLMGTTPIIQINKNETTTEKDIQQGIGFALKGLMQANRNPLSHEKKEYTEYDADAIILYTNYILEQINQSKTTAMDTVKVLLYDDNFTATEEYAKELLKEIPAKKRYDLLVSLYLDRSSLEQHRLTYFIPILYNSLTKAAKSDFIRVVDKDLMICQDNLALRMYFHYFMKFTYSELSRLSKLRIEALIRDSLSNGKTIVNNNGEIDCNSAGTLATWVDDKLDLLESKDELIDIVFNKIFYGGDEEGFVFEYFELPLCNLLLDVSALTSKQVKIIKGKLLSGDEYMYNFLYEYIEDCADKGIVDLFGTEFAVCKEKIYKAQGISTEELPF